MLLMSLGFGEIVDANILTLAASAGAAFAASIPTIYHIFIHCPFELYANSLSFSTTVVDFTVPTPLVSEELSNFATKKLKVLLVEDSPLVAKITSLMLSRQGHDVCHFRQLIVGLSANEIERDEDEGDENQYANFDYFIPKPLNMKDLYESFRN